LGSRSKAGRRLSERRETKGGKVLFIGCIEGGTDFALRSMASRWRVIYRSDVMIIGTFCWDFSEVLLWVLCENLSRIGNV
jgi:hypothetical protein